MPTQISQIEQRMPHHALAILIHTNTGCLINSNSKGFTIKLWRVS